MLWFFATFSTPDCAPEMCTNDDAQVADFEREHENAQDFRWMVEPGGIEPPTSCMPCKRSTN
jgi:hypothetical protein